jgi:esterase
MQTSWPIPSYLTVIEINGYPLTCAERGKNAPLVLVHGSIVDYRIWANVIEPFAAQYRVITPNLRHYYPEPWRGEAGNFSAEQHADDLAALSKALDLGKAHWLGWSRGGTVITEIAKRHPNVVRSLIMEDGGIDMPVPETEQTREAATFTRNAQGTLRDNIRKGDLKHAAQVFSDTLNGDGWWAARPDAVREMILQNIYTALGDARRPVTSHDEVRRFDFPVLLMTGERSPQRYMFYYDEMRKCRNFPEPVVVPNAAHAVHLDNPERFIAVVLDFLSKH